MKFYVDTSVWGGYEDKEFIEWSIPFFKHAQQGKFQIVISVVTIGELIKAPTIIRDLPTSIPPEFLEVVSINDEHLNHAQHIAIATVLKVDSLVSWNFKHMVNFFRIRQYNSINLKYGYSTIDIRTPKEITYGEE